MPDRIYPALHEPPNMSDRVFSHPGTSVTTWMIGLVGTALAVDGLLPTWLVGTYLGDIPDIVKFIGGAVLALGGLLSWIGLNWRPTRFDMSWALERAGWFITLITSLALIAAVLYAEPQSAIWLLPVQWAITGILRFHSLRVIEKDQRRLKAAIDAERVIK